MNTLITLTSPQAAILQAAADSPYGRVVLPDALRGGARAKVQAGLLVRGLIESAEDSHWLTDAGYEATVKGSAIPSGIPTLTTVWRASR